ncbi:MAG TPA: ATP-binding protein [Steroidobacteraceae bacterium]|nr:ATP-binding protein [Steroidobacteraceae bacterium]
MHAPSGTAQRPEVYLALLAHELRNLLAPIRYAIAALENPGRTSAQEAYALDIMRRHSQQMSHLLEELLDASRFARGEMELKKAAAELTVILGTAIEAARPLLDRKQHTLAIRLPDDAVRLWADSPRLVQVFSNLLVNAAKYTDPGGRIELQAIREGDHVRIAVRDSGIGISQDMMPRIFTLFAQDSINGSRSEGGLGIGLALAQGIVRLHDGTIEASSDGPDTGSEFVVRLPLGTPPDEPITPTENEPRGAGNGLRVLVVDDNKEVADTCAMLMDLSGHKVQCAYTGVSALEIAEQFRPEVILTDIGLPDIDGHAFARRVRETQWGRAAVLVAVTGWGEAELRQQSVAAGFAHHLTKPVDPKTIESLLRDIEAGAGR